MLGYLALGWAVPWLARNGLTPLRLVAASTALMLCVEVAIAFAGGSGAWLLWLALALASTGQSLAQTHVSLSMPEHLTGRAFTAYNLLSMGGIFLAQWLFGVTVDALGGLGGDDADTFRRAMLVWVAIQFGALMVLVFWRVQPRKAAA
jgi:MFS-type transporter involved in bile tolerance (Atg22 family)